MAYNNNSSKSTFIKTTGQAVIDNSYIVGYSSLINPDDRLSSSIGDQDELVVVRKFDTSTISDANYTHASSPVTAAEAWSAYTLPNSNDSGSTMYTIDSVKKEIIFKTTSASGEYTWTTEQSGRAANIDLPVVAAADTIFILRKTYSLTKLVEFTSGSRINADNLNYIIDQLLFMGQENLDSFFNLHEWNPILGMPNGIATLDATGGISNSFMNISSEGGLTGIGTADDKLKLDLSDNSLVVSSEKLKVNTEDSLASTSTTQPLSANQGRELKAITDSLSTGISYKGTIDIDDGAGQAAPSAIAGDTYDIIETSGSTTITLTNFNSLSVTKGDVIRYSGSTWVKIQSAPYVRQDGTSTLSGHMDISGDTFNFKFTTQATNNNTTFPATTAYVKQEIEAALLEELSDVGAYSSGTGSAVSNGQILKRVSGAWQNINPNDATNGITLQNLSNVSDSPSTGEFLKWDGSAWVTAGTGASAQIATAVAGSSANGTSDDQSAVQTGMQTAGIIDGTGSGTSIFGSTDLLGRHFGVNSSIATFTKSDAEFRHGRLNWTKSNSDGTQANGTMMTCPTEVILSTFLSSAASTGDYSITVDSGSNFNEDDLIQIYTHNDSSTNNDLGLRNSSKIHQLELHYIDRVDGATLYLKDPLLHSWVQGTLETKVVKKGSTTNAAQQPHDIIIKDMVFDDTLHQWQNISHTDVDFDETGFGATDIRISWADHGLTDNAKATFSDIMIDHDNSGTKWTATPEWGTLNGYTMPVDQIDTGKFDCDFSSGATDAQWSSGESGNGSNSYGTCLGMIGASVGIHIENGYRIVFKNCRFKGFAFGQVKLTGCRDVSFEDCSFESLKWTGSEGNAIVLKQCRDISFKNCTFRNVSHGIAYDGTGSYSTLMGLTIDNCKFIGVTSGIRDINFGVMYDAKVTNTKVHCCSFNPYRNYPMADETISYPPTGIKLVGMKLVVDNLECNAQTIWDSGGSASDAAYIGHASASDAITENYGTGKGWSTYWTSRSQASYSGTTLVGTRTPVTAYGIKIVTFGKYDLSKEIERSKFEPFMGTTLEGNTGDAVKITNCNINAWLCGIHLSAEVGNGTSAQNLTNGVHINDNVVDSLCNSLTVYGGHVNNGGITNAYISRNTFEVGAQGHIARFPGYRKLQGLTGSSRGGNVQNCSAVSEFVEGPACPQFGHCVRWWQDRKGDYSEPVEGTAVIVYNDNINILDNTLINHNKTPNTIRNRYESDLIRLNSLTYGSTSVTTNRELLQTQCGKMIIWGRHVGGEMWNNGKAEPASPDPWKAGYEYRTQNTRGLKILRNTTVNKAFGDNYLANAILDQHSPFIKGMSITYEGWPNDRDHRFTGHYCPFCCSLITRNVLTNAVGKSDTAGSNDGASEYVLPNEEPISGMAQGKTAFADSIARGESYKTQNRGPFFYQKMGWAWLDGNNGLYVDHLAYKDPATLNWCGDNNTMQGGSSQTGHHENAQYHSGNSTIPQS